MVQVIMKNTLIKTNEISLELPNIERCWGADVCVHNGSRYYKSQLRPNSLSWDFYGIGGGLDRPTGELRSKANLSNDP